MQVSVHVIPVVTTDDVLSSNKKQTSYKASGYSTDGSRDCECVCVCGGWWMCVWVVCVGI